MKINKSLITRGLIVLIAVLGLAWQQFGDTGSASTGTAATERGPRDDAAKMLAAYEAQQGDLWIESLGVVERNLKDDREGSQHQRFIVRLSNGHTVLIAHNIDLAPRVPTREGDRVQFRGEFEWNPRGGVVHWTHHDPQGRHAGGWIDHAGQRYE